MVRHARRWRRSRRWSARHRPSDPGWSYRCCCGSGPGFDPYIPEGLATEGRSGSSEPPFGGISKDFAQNFTPNRKKTGRLTGFGVKCRLFGGERGWLAHQRPPVPTNASQAMVVKNVPLHTEPRPNPGELINAL
ncbi:transposase [Corynebacterium diphtheriae bv. mitis]|nr:transposase [Corynebacterium diphtheriae bv. mitis]MBG9281879.1 transposase [Corynebacterium diphtheriae bv. mitis]MBG9337231.1 transposase [Corynebacterium diphtheriae bv. mitis]